MRRFLNRFFPLILALLILIMYLHPTRELYVDLGEHLLRGQITVQTQQIPTTNLFSYTYPNYSYINLEWLTELLFYLIYAISGINGLIIFTALLILFSSAIIYKFAVKRSGILLSSYVALLYLIVLYGRVGILPENFSYLLLSLFIVTLYKFREKYTNLIWFLIPMELIWVNMHIYFIIGILLIGLFFLEALILFRDRDDGKYLRSLLIVLISACFVSLFNPYGLSGLLYPFTYGQNYAYTVSENLSPFMNYTLQGSVSVVFLAFIISCAFIVLLIILQIKKLRLVDVLISLSFMVVATFAVRDLGVFIFATFIPFTFMAGSLVRKYNLQEKTTLHKILLFGFPVVAVGVFLWTIAILGGIGLGIAHGDEDAVDFFINNNLNGPIFNDYNIGSYLAYRLYPKEKVFVDTRPEAYPAPFFPQVYEPMLQNLNAFEDAEKMYKFNTIMYGFNNGVPIDMGFLRYLIYSKGWKVVYLDDSTIIFVKNTSLNVAIIQKYAMNDTNFRIPENDTSFDTLFNLAHFLDLLGWKKSELAVNKRLYAINPKDCQILRNLIILSGQNNPSSSVYLFNYNLYCSTRGQ